MFAKACRIYRRHLHSSNVEALGLAVGHTINQIRPRAVTTLPWKKNCHLGLLGMTQFQVSAMDDHKNLRTLIGKLKIDWLNFPVGDILRQFTTLKDGILRGVFKQQAAPCLVCSRLRRASFLCSITPRRSES